jgi:hypothetical protein
MDVDAPLSSWSADGAATGRCTMPSIEDICSKDTKTLNTNVLLVVESGDDLATDSDKFHKPNNTVTDRRPTSLTESADDDSDEPVGNQLHDLLVAACDGVVGLKPVKETNLVTSCREKFIDDFVDFSFTKQSASQTPTLAFDDRLCNEGLMMPMLSVGGEDCRMKQCFQASAVMASMTTLSTVTTEIDNWDEHPDINNVKRIKMDDQAEKNVRMQTKLKVNTEQNRTRPSVPVENDLSTSSTSCHHHPDGDLMMTCSFSVGSSGSQQQQQLQQQKGRQQFTVNDVSCAITDRRQAQYVRSAQKAWREYTAQNRSVVVETFQGQFKSTVVCSDCHHVSVTFEPFMYLSVPLPHALERQISIIFVPCDNKQPVRYLLTVHRQDIVRKLREQLIAVLEEDESCDVVIAEVLDNHIARVLEDNMLVKSINESDRTVYAFEMLPPPVIEATEPDNSERESLDTLSSCGATNNTVCTSQTSTSLNRDIINDCFSVSLSAPTSTVVADEFLVDSSDLLNNRVDVTSGEIGGGVVTTSAAQLLLESNPDVNWQHNELSDTAAGGGSEISGDGTSHVPHTSNGSVSGSAKDDTLQPGLWESLPIPVLLNNMTGLVDDDDSLLSGGGGSVSDTQHNSGILFGSSRPFGLDVEKCSGDGNVAAGPLSSVDGNGPVDGGGDGETTVVSDQWKSCAICLEEKEDSLLVAHPSCPGTFCPACLEESVKHTSNLCPVCAVVVDPINDFRELTCMDSHKPKTRVLSMPIVNRYISHLPSTSSSSDDIAEVAVKLFGHPNILYLPSKLTGTLLYQTVDRVVPCLAYYSIVLTDGQGLHCSRCLYTQHCTGCELPRDGSEISLQPGDHLAVQFAELTNAQMDAAFRFVDHKSMEQLRSSEPLTLYDCLEAFAESELLDEHNPWYCPKCCKNQCASKTMSVWRYPDTLIVHLKRFVYHELSSTKIDNKVVFPLDGLDLSNYISGPATSELTYDLQSCVCHFGGANSGHYTAYSQQVLTGEWFYSNDETVVRQTPHDADYSNVYILFYQRRGTNVSFQTPQLPSGCCDSYDCDDDNDVGTETAAQPGAVTRSVSGSDLSLTGNECYDAASCPNDIFDTAPAVPADKPNLDFYQ